MLFPHKNQEITVFASGSEKSYCFLGMDSSKPAPSPQESGIPPPNQLEQELANGRALVMRVLRAHFPSVQPEQAEDIAQELMVVFWHQRERIRIPDAWFYTAARSRGLSAVSRRRANVPLEALREDEQPFQDDPEEHSESLRRLFFSLRDQCRKVLGRIVLAGWTLREVAEVAQCSVRQINEQRARCIKHLRRLWLDSENSQDEG